MFQKIRVCKKFDKPRESFLPNTDNFLAFFIVFKWGRILESAMDKQEVQLMQNYVEIVFLWKFLY